MAQVTSEVRDRRRLGRWDSVQSLDELELLELSQPLELSEPLSWDPPSHPPPLASCELSELELSQPSSL
jgi:hypothetical protein